MKKLLVSIAALLLLSTACKKNNHVANTEEPETCSFETTIVQAGGKPLELTCRLTNSCVQVPLEDLCAALGLECEACERCGHTSVTLKNKGGDILLVFWNAPYAGYQNREGRIKLAGRNVFEGGKTYVDVKILESLSF